MRPQRFSCGIWQAHLGGRGIPVASMRPQRFSCGIPSLTNDGSTMYFLLQ